MGKCTPRLIKIIILFFVRPFSGDSRNTALTLIVATNVCVRGIILGLTVKPPIDEGFAPGRSLSDNSYPRLAGTLFAQKEALYIKNI
jgi:hypothetical protein